MGYLLLRRSIGDSGENVKKINKSSKRKSLYGLISVATSITMLLSGCENSNNKLNLNTSSIGTTSSLDEIGEKELSTTEELLELYNSYLKSLNSDKILTEEDIKYIEENTNNPCIVLIKLNDNECAQIGTDYHFCEYENDKLILISREHPMMEYPSGEIVYKLRKDTYDLLTFEKLSDEIVKDLGTFYDYSFDKGVQKIGYTKPKFIGYSYSDKDFIIENYGDDVFRCLSKYGFPLPLYDVEDFYKVYNENKSQNKQKSLELKN